MKTIQIVKATLAAVLAVGMVLTAQVNAEEFDLQKADVYDRMDYHNLKGDNRGWRLWASC